VVTFTLYQARVIQASCDASAPVPSLDLSLRALYPLRDGRFSEDVVRKILRWLLGQNQPWAFSKPQALPCENKTTAGGVRVPSGGSE
jgi:hypothetical protein